MYEILELDNTAQIHDVKTNYYKLALKYHPDRVSDDQKAATSAHFNRIHRAYFILANPETKKVYDAGDEHLLFARPNMTGKWEQHIKIISTTDIDNARMKYQSSVAEEDYIAREVVIGSGSMTHLYNVIPFMRIEDESRIIKIVKKCIDEGKIPNIVIRKMRK